MTAAIEAAPAVGAGILLAMAAILAGLLVWASTGSDAPTWQPGELTAVTVKPDRPCTLCPARHCAGCEEPARVTATWTTYTARHDFGEVPPSVRSLAALMPVGLRATIVARAVNPRWRPRPVTRAALELWGRKVARRHGIACTLGTFTRPVLP